jgi:diguanylate cyclase (GGDEF)-like protein/PAS domain S-box-containing protein
MAAQPAPRGAPLNERRKLGRLAIRHATLAALLGAAIGAAFSVQQISEHYRLSVEQERREITQMLAIMREPAAQASYNLNEQAAQVIVQGGLSHVSARRVSLVNDFGETLARADEEAGAPTAQAWWARFVEPTQQYSLALEYGPARKRVGELTVVTSQAPRVERFLQSAWHDMGLNVLRSVAVALALGVLSYVTLTRPLTAIARRIGHGPAQSASSSPLPEAARPDEIGEIAAAFERYEREAGERALSLESSARALAASEMRYRRIVETAGEGVWQVDAQGRTTLANAAMARMLGTTPDLLMGRSLFEFVAAADRPAAESLLHERHGQENARHEIRFMRADGQEVWAEVSTCPIADAEGHPCGTLAMVTNANERRRRDEELRATNARLTAMVANLERHKSDMAHIAELNELLQSSRTEAEAFGVIRTAAARLFAEHSGGFAVAGQGDEMIVVGAWGAEDCLPGTYSRSACWAIRRGGPHLQPDRHGIRCGHQPAGQGGAMLCAPLYVSGELIGVLHLLGDDIPESPSDTLRQRSEVFGEVVKLGLSNLRLRDSLREQALRDALTSLPNRRLFDETLPRELARCLRAEQPLTLAIVDVDHFKRFNDTYGHDAGDHVLRSVAQVLVESIRGSDLACRYGGDEFLCLLPGMNARDAATRFEQALARMAKESDGKVLQGETITFTVGLASAPDSGNDVTTLTRAADAALYAAKERGRNCVQIAPPSTDGMPCGVSRMG